MGYRRTEYSPRLNSHQLIIGGKLIKAVEPVVFFGRAGTLALVNKVLDTGKLDRATLLISQTPVLSVLLKMRSQRLMFARPKVEMV